MGQPFNEYAKITFIQLVTSGLSLRSVADKMDFTWRTVKEHIDSDDEFRERLEEAMLVATGQIEDRLYTEAKGGNLGAIKFWLSNRGVGWRDERDRTPVGGGGGTSEIAVTVNLVGALREAFQQEDTRPAVLEMSQAIPAASRTKP